MRSFFIYILVSLPCILLCHAQKRDFGNEGQKGLSYAQLAQLVKGEIVFLNADSGNGDITGSLIEAAMLFSASPETTWELISKTDAQPKYIEQCKEIKVIKKSPRKVIELHTVGNWVATYTYGVIQNLLPENRCLYWALDTSYAENDLIALSGYWQFYPYGKGQTLARYGSSISFKKISEFVISRFKKSGVKDGLVSVKKYVDSGGTYHK